MTDERAAHNRVRGVAQFVIVGAILMAVALTLDGWVVTHVHDELARREDWHRLLRVAGYLPTWLFIAVAFALVDRSVRKPDATGKWADRGAYLAIVVVSAGLLAEALKLVLRRERPQGLTDYVFRPIWVDTLSTSNLGLPSSHATVAFAGAFALCRLFPAARPLWFLLAAGCGLTRLLDGGHFLSDVALGALAGYAAAWALALVMRPVGVGPGSETIGKE